MNPVLTFPRLVYFLFFFFLFDKVSRNVHKIFSLYQRGIRLIYSLLFIIDKEKYSLEILRANASSEWNNSSEFKCFHAYLNNISVCIAQRMRIERKKYRKQYREAKELNDLSFKYNHAFAFKTLNENKLQMIWSSGEKFIAALLKLIVEINRYLWWKFARAKNFKRDISFPKWFWKSKRKNWNSSRCHWYRRLSIVLF